MARFVTPMELALTPEEMDAFRYQLTHPDREAAKRRDAFFAELDCMDIRELPDGSYEVSFEEQYQS